MRALLLVLALAGASMAGCLTPGADVGPQSTLDLGPLLPQEAPLWPDHQNEPHPAYGWPTLTRPAASGAPAWWTPIAPADLTAIQGLAHVAKAPGGVQTGAGIALFGSLAVVPGLGENHVLDIRDPAAPGLLGTWEGDGRGAAIMAMPDGRLYAVVSTAAGFDVVDLTDPTAPEIVGNATPKTGGHKVGLVPGTPIVYNANSNGGGATSFTSPDAGAGQTEIYDLSDPESPALVQEFRNGYGCHHIFFWSDASQQKHRAVCAGIEYTQIWDIADPKDPKVIVSLPVHHANRALPSTSAPNILPLMFSHTAMLSQDGTVLIVGDELMGGGTAECDGVHTPAKDASGPFGNLWFYDVKDEKNPKLLGWFSPPPRTTTDPRPPSPPPSPSPFLVFGGWIPGCTAHHGRLVPDPEGERELLVMAWYGAGVVLVDFTDPTDPRLVDEWNAGTNTWEAWYYNGYVFTGDLARGFDVLTFK